MTEIFELPPGCPVTVLGVAGSIVGYAISTRCTAGELRRFARDLITTLDHDGPEPNDRDRTSELFLSRNRDGSGGRIKGELDTSGFTPPEAVMKPSA
jgi:hypothetical protein